MSTQYTTNVDADEFDEDFIDDDSFLDISPDEGSCGCEDDADIYDDD